MSCVRVGSAVMSACAARFGAYAFGGLHGTVVEKSVLNGMQKCTAIAGSHLTQIAKHCQLRMFFSSRCTNSCCARAGTLKAAGLISNMTFGAEADDVAVRRSAR